MKLHLALTISDATGVKFSDVWKGKLDEYDLTADQLTDGALAGVTLETLRRGAAELIESAEENATGLIDRIQARAEDWHRQQKDPAQGTLPGQDAPEPKSRRSRTLPKANEPEAGA